MGEAQVGILAFPSVMYDTLPRQFETLYLPRSMGYQISGRPDA